MYQVFKKISYTSLEPYYAVCWVEFFLAVCFINIIFFSILAQRNQKGEDEIVVALVLYEALVTTTGALCYDSGNKKRRGENGRIVTVAKPGLLSPSAHSYPRIKAVMTMVFTVMMVMMLVGRNSSYSDRPLHWRLKWHQSKVSTDGHHSKSIIEQQS